MSGDVVEPTTEEWKALVSKIQYSRSEIRLAREPWLHRVSVGRHDIEQMSWQQRPHMCVYNFVDGAFLRGRRRSRPPGSRAPSKRDCNEERGSDSHLRATRKDSARTRSDRRNHTGRVIQLSRLL